MFSVGNIFIYKNISDATEWPENITVRFRFPAVMRTPMIEHPLRASWRTNLLFPLFPRPGPRDADDMYGGKTPGWLMFFYIDTMFSME